MSVLRITQSARLTLSVVAYTTAARTGAVLAIRFCAAAGPSDAHSCASILTAVLATMALALGWAGRTAGRWELTKVPYVLLAIATVKLLVQDLPAGHTFGIVISLLMYGSALVLLPRLSRNLITAD